MKPLLLTDRALRDLDDARVWYAGQAPHMTTEFARAADGALRHLQAHPGTGSPRWGQRLGVPKLRGWPVSRFPYLVLYVEEKEQILIIRILHQSRDIPAHLQG